MVVNSLGSIDARHPSADRCYRRCRGGVRVVSKVGLEDLDLVGRDDCLGRGRGEVGEAGDARCGGGVVGHVARACPLCHRRLWDRLWVEEPAAAVGRHDEQRWES